MLEETLNMVSQNLQWMADAKRRAVSAEALRFAGTSMQAVTGMEVANETMLKEV